jgi:predicted PurR-regulated permease PerM
MDAPSDRTVLHATAPPPAPSRNPYTLGFLIVASAATLALCYVMAEPFLTAILFAAVIAIVFYPVHLRIWGWVHGPNRAALISTLLVLLVVVLPVVALGAAVRNEIHETYAFLSLRSARGGGSKSRWM